MIGIKRGKEKSVGFFFISPSLLFFSLYFFLTEGDQKRKDEEKAP